MYFRPAVEKPKPVWRGSIPVSCASCMRFTTSLAAKKHAKETSLSNAESRHVIHTGDYFFSSTTAQVFWYEKLIVTYVNGVVVKKYIRETDNVTS